MIRTWRFYFLSHDVLANKSELKRDNYQIGNTPLLINRIEIGREDLSPGSEMAIPVTSFRGVREVFVIGDIHGEYSRVVNLLKNNGIVDDNIDWIWGKGHLVFMGDIFDRGNGVTETLWMIFNLEKQAEAAGGKVHLLLGNHEPMIFEDDIRYVADDYYSLCENLGLSYSELFSHETVLGLWLRQKPVILSINNYLFAHAGLSPEMIEEAYTAGYNQQGGMEVP
ncbi:MAG: metallophosphoesterase [Marinilabiliales bacterium]|nr:metallophosphoesterase [Marinilabiliales bacterium]